MVFSQVKVVPDSLEPRASSCAKESSAPRTSLSLGHECSTASRAMDFVVSFSRSEKVNIRAVPAGQALRRLGRMFRADGGEAYLHSRCVSNIATFWSHSWHAPAWCKILTLCLYHNGWQAALCGTAASALLTACFPVDVLRYREVAGLAGVWFGFLGTAVALLCWPSRDSVFLDKACIPQDDEKAKRQGILSLGSFLQMSRTMLVLWDSSYFTRLWCVFEIAARRKIQEQDPKVGKTVILPIFYSAIMLFAFAGHNAGIVFCNMSDLLRGGREAHPTAREYVRICVLIDLSIFFGCLLIAHPLRRFCLDHQQKACQLKQFSIQDAKCFCCSHNHRHPETQQTLPCDRQLIESVVVGWFGTTDAFDTYVRGDLADHSVKRAIVPYRLVAFICLPFLWEAFGQCVWLLKDGQIEAGFNHLANNVFQAFVWNPVEVFVINRTFITTCGKALRGYKYVCLLIALSFIAALVNFPLLVFAHETAALLGLWWHLVPNTIIFTLLTALCYWGNF